MANLTARQEFLLAMYRQMYSDVENHFKIAWQSIGALIGSIAIISFSDQIISFDVGATFAILLCWWMLSTIQDANYWYNRNLAIITNIEKEFLSDDDSGLIHPYFTQKRPRNSMISHLRIQNTLGICIGLIVISLHSIDRILPGLLSPVSHFEPMRAFPIVAALLAILNITNVARSNEKKYQEFLRMAPGKQIAANTAPFVHGHGSE